MNIKNKKQKIYIILFTFFLVFAFLWQRYYYQKINIRLGGEELKVLVVKSIYQQKKGLGGRDKFEDFDAMMFTFSTLSRHAIVMRDMNFSIDVIWLKNDEIIDMAPHVDPEPGVVESDLRVYYPRSEVNIILELPVGFIEENNLKIGDKMEIVE